MRIQAVLDEDDLLGLGKVNVAQILENAGVIDGRAALGDLWLVASAASRDGNDMPKALQRRKEHEQVGCPLALVLIVVARGLTGLHGQGRARLGDPGSGFAAPELLGSLVEADQPFSV